MSAEGRPLSILLPIFKLRLHIKVAVAKAMATEGGEGEIRTREELAPLAVFKTAALDQLCDLSLSGGCGSRTHSRLAPSKFSKLVS